MNEPSQETPPSEEQAPKAPPSDAEKIAALEEALKEQKQRNLLLLADMENVRKRLHKEKVEMNRFAIDNLLCEVLMPLDNFENALSFTEKMSEETRNWAIGFEMILNQFKEVLLHHRVKPFESKGKQFDPHRHEAVEMVETSEVPDGTITHELLRGYESEGRIVRPARVKVAKRPQTTQKTETEEE